MECKNYFQPFIDHLTHPSTPAHTPILTFLASGNRSEANRYVVYMEGELGLSETSQRVDTVPQALPELEGQHLVGFCNAYFSDRVRSEGGKTLTSSQQVETGSGEITVSPNAVASNAEITVSPNAVAVTPSEPQVLQLSHVQRFDVNHFDTLDVSLSLPNGPLTLRADGNIVSRFSLLECRENGLLVCTSDLDRSILVLSFQAQVRSLEP